MEVLDKAWFDGKVVDYKNIKLPLLTHSLMYGSGIFEGIRAYETIKGAAIFRLSDHINRFFDTAKIYSMNMNYNKEEITNAVISVVKSNNAKSCYIHPSAFYNTDQIGISTFGKKISVSVAAVDMGRYIKRDNEEGIKCKISSWTRISSSQLPIKAKASGNYLNSIIANTEAKSLGFDEAILISQEGYVNEGSGENIFIVKNNELITPNTDSDILDGITRNTVIKIAKDSDIKVSERRLHREELYTADEIFFTGTAAEITPISNVDNIIIGNRKVGILTNKILSKYNEIIHGKDTNYSDWLTYV